MPFGEPGSFVAAARNDDTVIRTRRALENLAAREGVGEAGLCGIVGPYDPKNAALLSSLAVSYQTPLVSYHAPHSDVGRNHRLALTAAVAPGVDGRAEAFVEHVLVHRGRDYVALLYNGEDFSYIADAFRQAAERLGAREGRAYNFRAFPVGHGSGDGSIERALEDVQNLGWKTLVGAFPRIDQWERVYDAVEARGMDPAGGGYVWYSFDTSDLDMLTVGDAAWVPRNKEDPGLPGRRARLLDGLGVFRVLNGPYEEDMRCDGDDDDASRRFLCAWRNQTAADVTLLRDLHPVRNWARGAGGRYDPGDGYFQEEDPPAHAAAAYDAVIAVGMAACRARHLPSAYESRKRGGGAPEFPFTNQDSRLYNELAINTTFAGASGEVQMNDGTIYVRPPETLTFGVQNVRAVPGPGNGTAYETSLASVRRPGENWTDIGEFLYAGGTPVEPANFVPPPEPVESRAAFYAAVSLGAVVGAALLGAVVYLLQKRYRSYLRISQAHERLMESTLDQAEAALRQIDYPLHLLRGDEFATEGELVQHEVLRNMHRHTVLDSLGDVDAFIEAGNHIVFFSHQWTSYTAPDPSGDQYRVMVSALRRLAKQKGWDPSLRRVFVWVDFGCIPQANASTQMLAIRSLAAYASSATYFVICAPDVPHAETRDLCTVGTYQRRTWCRAEQVCHSMRNGTSNIFLAAGGDGDGDAGAALPAVPRDFFRQSLRVFGGELTCCRLGHPHGQKCDRLSLVVPILGLYGELYRASLQGGAEGGAGVAGVAEYLSEIERHQDAIFPRSFKWVTKRKGKQVAEEVLLFGDLIDRMRARVKSGPSRLGKEQGGEGTTETVSVYSRKDSDSTFIRHGFVHGTNPKTNERRRSLQVETAIRMSQRIDQDGIDKMFEGIDNSSSGDGSNSNAVYPDGDKKTDQK